MLQVLLNAFHLASRQFLGLPANTGEKNQDVILEVFPPLRAKRYAIDDKVVPAAELDHIESAHGCKRLVLATYRFAQNLTFNLDGFIG